MDLWRTRMSIHHCRHHPIRRPHLLQKQLGLWNKSECQSGRTFRHLVLCVRQQALNVCLHAEWWQVFALLKRRTIELKLELAEETFYSWNVFVAPVMMRLTLFLTRAMMIPDPLRTPVAVAAYSISINGNKSDLWACNIYTCHIIRLAAECT